MTDAIVLAGGGEGEIEKKFGVVNRSLLVIKNKFMIEYVIEALKSVSSIKRIIVVGPVKEIKCRIGSLVEEVVPPGENPFESAWKGLEALQTREKVLIAGSDLPLLKGEMVEDFLLRCSKEEADFYYPIIRREIYEKKLNDSQRTFVRLRDGCFTGGDILFLNPQMMEKKKEWLSRIVESRKNPVALARLIGAKVIFKYLTRQLTIKDVEERVDKMLGIKALAVITPYPEMGFDVDKVGHVQVAERILKK